MSGYAKREVGQEEDQDGAQVRAQAQVRIGTMVRGKRVRVPVSGAGGGPTNHEVRNDDTNLVWTFDGPVTRSRGDRGVGPTRFLGPRSPLRKQGR